MIRLDPPPALAGSPRSKAAWPWRLLAVVLVLCLAAQGLATAIQRTTSRAHFHLASQVGSQVVPRVGVIAQATAPASTSRQQQITLESRSAQVLTARRVDSRERRDLGRDNSPRGDVHPHGDHHDQPVAHTHGDDDRRGLLQAGAGTPRLFVHTYELDEPRVSRPATEPPRKNEPPHTHEPGSAHGELAQHDHAADMAGVVYVDDGVTASSPAGTASASRAMNDLDSLVPAKRAESTLSSGQVWPDAPGPAMPTHISAVPLRPPSV